MDGQAGGPALPQNAAVAGNAASAGSGGNSASSNGGAGGGSAQAGAPAKAGAGGSTPAMSAGTGGSTTTGSGGVGQQATGGSGGATGNNSGVAGPGVEWAAGGTKSMGGGYPDPFEISAGGTPCVVYPTQTLGPCYTMGPEMREDISDGATGLPMRLSFLVVRADGCTPVAGASVDIWHSGFEGVYSAYATGSICNPGTMDVTKDMFCRGAQVTDRLGRVNFSTIFPGWYSSRSVHIHFTIRVNGAEMKTSQLYFEDDLTTEIQAQGEYKPRGMRTTTNATDFTFLSGNASAEQVLMSTAKRPDGTLHAWKILSIG